MPNPSDLSLSRLRTCLLSPSRQLAHLHVYGLDESGLRQRVFRLLNEIRDKEKWLVVFCSWLYAGGAFRQLLASLNDSLNLTRGKAQLNTIKEFTTALNEKLKSTPCSGVIICLDHAESISAFASPSAINAFFDFPEFISSTNPLVRLLTIGERSWSSLSANFAIGQPPIPEFYFPVPEKDDCILLLCSALPEIDPTLVKFVVDSAYIHCRHPNKLAKLVLRVHTQTGGIRDVKARGVALLEAQSSLLGTADTPADKLRDKLKQLQLNDDEKGNENGNVHLMMPAFQKYLLLASFCASNNATVTDKRHFVKHHGREKRSEARERRAAEAFQQLDPDPKTAELQRIIAICLVLLKRHYPDEQLLKNIIDLNSLMNTLGCMGLVVRTSATSNLDTPRYKCLASLDTAKQVARSLNIDLTEYLEHPN